MKKLTTHYNALFYCTSTLQVSIKYKSKNEKKTIKFWAHEWDRRLSECVLEFFINTDSV